MIRLALILLGLLGSALPARAELPSEPILRLEPGMHGAGIWRIDVDAGERFLVTGSDDKTVRVWSLDDGRPFTTLRMPSGEGNVGKVFAVAISPDGAQIAAGGWGPGSDGQNNSVYLFDRVSGRIVQRIDGLRNAIVHLAFSPDGQHLVACLSANGIRVYETEGFREIAADRDYGDYSLGAAFDRDGSLVTSSLDGQIRLYDPEFRLSESEEAPGGKPYGVAFSPDGARIAVGYDDSTQVDVLDRRTLAPLFSADTSGANWDLSKVAWSLDGAFLYAAGRNNAGGRQSARRWSAAGQGEYEDIALADSTIMGLRPLAGGDLAFGAQDPSIGVVGPNGQILWRQGPAQADFRNQTDKLAISVDGTRVAFGFESFGRSPAVFDLLARRLTLNPNADPRLATAQVTSEGLEIKDWKYGDTPKYGYKPTLNGVPLALEPGETPFSLAIAPDGERFLLGTHWNVRLFNRQGAQLWDEPGSGAWAVNVTGDGRVAIAAFGDGTIRWFRLEDGAELLAFFPHTDRERWVVWTPQGYYMASPGGEALIGWHVNHGLDAPEFYTAGRFHDRFHRPDVIALVLEELDVQKALARADAAAGVAAVTPSPQEVKEQLVATLPPVVEIIDPQSGASHHDDFLTVTYLIRASGSVPPEVSARLDGQVVKTQTLGGKLEGEVFDQISLPLAGRVKDKEFVVSLVAEDDHGASDPASVSLTWGGANTPEKKVDLYVLAVGVSDYSSEPPRDLDYAAKDADDLVTELLRQKEWGLYRDVKVQALTDKDASLIGILGGLDWLRQQVDQGDVAIVFFAGHGIDEGFDYYFLPHTVEIRTSVQLSATSLGKTMLLAQLGAIYGKGAKVLAFIDTCYSGAREAGTRAGLPADVDKLALDLASAGNGVVVFTSSTGREVAYEDRRWENGAFTEALLEALAGRARPGGRHVSVSDLKRYLRDRVIELTDGAQTPQVWNETKLEVDAPIFVVR